MAPIAADLKHLWSFFFFFNPATMCVKQRGIPSPILQGHKKAVVCPRPWRAVVMEQRGILFLAVRAGGLGKRKDQKREKLIEQRATSWQRTRKHHAGETAGVPDRMQAAQLVWMCDREMQDEGLVTLLPTHVSRTFLSLNPFPSTPVHLSMQICISSPCSEAGRHRAVILEVSDRHQCGAPGQQQGWMQRAGVGSKDHAACSSCH